MPCMAKKPGRGSPGRSFNRSNVAFWVFLLLAVVAGALMYRAATTRGPADTGYRSSYTPAQATPASPAPGTTPPSAAPTTVAILGDPYTGGPAVGGARDANWTMIAANTLSAAGKPVQFAVATQDSSGYVKPSGATGTALAQVAAETVKADNRVVVVFDSVSDAEQSRDAVRSAAAATYSQIKSAAPKANLIVVGPSWTNTTVPANVKALRDTLQAEAKAAGAMFVDPLADKWFVGDNGKLVGADGVHLTDQGHINLAGLIEPRIAAALG